MQEFHPYVFQILAQLIDLSDTKLAPVSISHSSGGLARPGSWATLLITLRFVGVRACARMVLPCGSHIHLQCSCPSQDTKVKQRLQHEPSTITHV